MKHLTLTLLAMLCSSFVTIAAPSSVDFDSSRTHALKKTTRSETPNDLWADLPEKDLKVFQDAFQPEANFDPVLEATKSSSVLAVKKLVDVYSLRSDSAVLEAARQNHNEILSFLVTRGMKHDWAVVEAAKHNNMDAVELLVSHGMKHNFAIREAAMYNNFKMVLFLQRNNMNYPL